MPGYIIQLVENGGLSHCFNLKSWGSLHPTYFQGFDKIVGCSLNFDLSFSGLLRWEGATKWLRNSWFNKYWEGKPKCLYCFSCYGYITMALLSKIIKPCCNNYICSFNFVLITRKWCKFFKSNYAFLYVSFRLFLILYFLISKISLLSNCQHLWKIKSNFKK